MNFNSLQSLENHSNGTMGGHKFVSAQHTVAVLSIVGGFWSTETKYSIGRVLCKTVYFCFNDPITRST